MKEKLKQFRENYPKLSFLTELLFEVAMVILCAFLIIEFVATRSIVDGTSMTDTLQDNDNLIVEKVSYWFHGPERFDIIIIDIDKTTKTHYVKRVVGLPGETVQIIDGYVYINGEMLEEDIYGKDLILNPGSAATPVVLGEDEYFVLGDNRNNSSDSRFSTVGKVKRNKILGKVWLRFYPFNTWTVFQ